jgi:hypothetical protein
MWFTAGGANGFIGSINASGKSNYVAAVPDPGAITSGPDGNLWFTTTNGDGGSIEQITTSGTVTTFANTGIYFPYGITSGPDGNLWFTNYGNNSIGRISTKGKVTNFTGTGINEPEAITTRPDGNLWFTNFGNSTIGEITPKGTVFDYTGNGISDPEGIVAAPDGALWFTNYGDSTIGRITTNVTPEITSILPSSGASGAKVIIKGKNSYWSHQRHIQWVYCCYSLRHIRQDRYRGSCRRYARADHRDYPSGNCNWPATFYMTQTGRYKLSVAALRGESEVSPGGPPDDGSPGFALLRVTRARTSPRRTRWRVPSSTFRRRSRRAMLLRLRCRGAIAVARWRRAARMRAGRRGALAAAAARRPWPGRWRPGPCAAARNVTSAIPRLASSRSSRSMHLRRARSCRPGVMPAAMTIAPVCRSPRIAVIRSARRRAPSSRQCSRSCPRYSSSASAPSGSHGQPGR